MLEDLNYKKHLKTGIVLYTLIIIPIIIDIVNDYNEGMHWKHVAIELLVFVIAVIGISILANEYYKNMQFEIQSLSRDLIIEREQSAFWRKESSELIQGLGVEIQKQFLRWQLTEAESEIGLFILKGFSHQEIADIRHASERTVREQARVLYRKAGLTGRSSLSAFFLEDLLLPASKG